MPEPFSWNPYFGLGCLNQNLPSCERLTEKRYVGDQSAADQGLKMLTRVIDYLLKIQCRQLARLNGIATKNLAWCDRRSNGRSYSAWPEG